MRMPAWRTGLIGLSLGLLSACGDINQEPEVDEVIEFSSLADYQTLSGTVGIRPAVVRKRQVEKVKLFVGDSPEPVATSTFAPFTLAWDTTATPDGLYRVAWQAETKDDEPQTSEVISLVVLNKGFVPTVMDINADPVAEGELDIDEHIKHYWENPDNIREILALVSWTPAPGQAEWEIEATMGQGFCPHRGVQYGPGFGSPMSPVTVQLNAGQLDPPQTTFPKTPPNPDWATEIYFVHIGVLNPSAHLGETAPYEVRVFLFE